jgi:hypothetical protein
MSTEWLDRLEAQKRSDDRKQSARVINTDNNNERLIQSKIASRVKRICDEVNRRAGVTLKFQTGSSLEREVAIEGPGDPCHYMRIYASENGIILEFGIRASRWLRNQLNDTGWGNLEKIKRNFDCQTMIDTSSFSDEDIYDCIRYLHQEKGKPKVISNERTRDNSGSGFMSCFMGFLNRLLNAR